MIFKFLLLSLIYLNVSANSFTFLVDNTTMVDVYYNIFNAISSIFGDNNYIGVLRLAFLSGGFFVFMAAVLKDSTKSIQEFTKYMLIGTTILTLTFSHKSNIEIKTNSLPTYCSNTSSSITSGTVVGNIPTSFAFVAATANKMGAEMTSLSKSSFSALTNNTSALSRSDFAQSLDGIGKIMTTSISQIDSQSGNESDSTIGENFVSITNDCILIPAGQDNTFGPLVMDTFKRTGNTQATMTDLIMNGTVVKYLNPTDLMGTLIEPSITLGGIEPKNLLTTVHGEVLTCEAAMLRLNTKLDTLKYSGTIECMNQFSDSLSPTTLQVLTGSNLGSPEMGSIILNVALANQISESKRNLSNINEMSYATTKSMVEVSLQSKASGNYLAEMLPYLQTGMRAILYAFFPFIFIVILLPGGSKVLLSYLKSIIWIELWTPAAAILDMFLNIEATNKMSNLYTVNGLNPMSMFQVFSDANMLAGVAGYLYASVPAITWLILNLSGEALGSIGVGLMGGMTASGHGSIVEKNLDSKLQNQDRMRVKQAQLAGVSISKFESNEANHKAQQNAGAWLTNQAHAGDLLSSSKGAELSKIISGNISNATLDNKQAQDAAMIKAKVGIKQDIETQKALGLDTPAGAALGSMGNDDGIKKVTGIKAKEEQIKVAIAGKTQEVQGTADTNPDSDKNIKKIAGIEATDATIKLESKDKYQKLMGSDVINETSTVNALKELDSVKKFGADVEQRMKNTGASAADAVIQTAQIAGKDDAYKYEQIKETLDHYAGEKGTIGKDGKLHYNPKGEENILKNKEKIAAIAADIEIGKNKAEISSSDWQTFTKRAKEQEKAKAMATQTENRNIVQKLAAHGDGNAARLEKELARVNKKGQAIYSESQKSMKRAEYIATSNKDAAAFQTMSSQGQAVKSLQYGLGGFTTGELKAMIAKTNVDSGKDLGQAMINNGGGTIMKLAQSNLKLGGKDYKQLSPTQKTAVAAEAISIMGNTPKAQSTAVSNVAAHGNQKAYKGNAVAKLADTEQTKTQAEVAKLETITNFLKESYSLDGENLSKAEVNARYGELLAYQEGLNGAKDILDMLNELASGLTPGRNSKVTGLKESIINDKRAKFEKETKIAENNKRILAITEELKNGNANKALFSELQSLNSDNKIMKSELKNIESSIKDLNSKIQDLSKTQVNQIKEEFRPLSEIEKSYKAELQERAASKAESARITKEMNKIALEAEKAAANPNLMNPKLKPSTGMKVASGGMRVLGTAAIGYTVYEGYEEGSARYNKGDTTGAVIVSGKTASIIAGAIYGAEAGAIGFGAAGSVIPLAGTAAGGIVGGLLGGIAGAGIAAWGGDTVLDAHDKKKF